MDSVDFTVLKTASEWQKREPVWLATVIKTYGSSPRPIGSMLAIKQDGSVVGSVSGGCIEDDLIDKARNRQLHHSNFMLLTYGQTPDEGRRFGLPCGGSLVIGIEPIINAHWLEECLALLGQHRLVQRVLDTETMSVSVENGDRDSFLSFDGNRLKTIFGPTWRLIIIGSGQISTYIASMALPLNFEVVICDPRGEFMSQWDVPNTHKTMDMPDDAIQALNVDSRTAVVAVSHDLKLDDLALLEALKSPAFYVGALGSKLNNLKRRERLAMFDLSASEIDRLHGPIGIDIHSKTPPEIAISIIAHIISIKNQINTESKPNLELCVAS